tara:strand:+ start:112339 stop:113415 length:1077 start_codon:yes stop_codon:yes gene_type:complete
MTDGPLAGIRILSLAEQYPGPFATLLLADLGADVILVERPEHGDPARAYPTFFRALARNKRSVCLDLKSAGGKAQFKTLVEGADVVLEGFRPGKLAALGLGAADLRAIYPRLIYASITGFGQTGPYRDRPAHDISYQAVAGHLAPGGAAPALPYGDLCGGMYAALAVVTALLDRERTGESSTLDIAIADGLVSWMIPDFVLAGEGEEPLRIADGPAYGCFPCADGRMLTISLVHEKHFWRSLCDVLGMAEFSDLSWSDQIARAPELKNRITMKISDKTLDEWSVILDRHHIPWSQVNSAADVLRDPHFAARNLFRRSGNSTSFDIIQPIQFDRFRSSIRRSAPALGEHNDDLLGAHRN